MENMKFCQSCAMPLTDDLLGTEKDGTKSADYCHYCYKDGEFTSETTMDEMIEFCADIMAKENAGMSREKAIADMNAFFPTLKRWAK